MQGADNVTKMLAERLIEQGADRVVIERALQGACGDDKRFMRNLVALGYRDRAIEICQRRMSELDALEQELSR